MKSSWNMGLTVSQKLNTPNLLYLVLLTIVIFFYFSSGSLIREMSKKQKDLFVFTEKMRDFAYSAKDFMNKKTAYSDLGDKYTALKSDMKGVQMQETFSEIWMRVENIHKIRKDTDAVKKDIEQLTAASMKESNEFIRMISQKLADEEQRHTVSKLERAVIVSANANTISNYEIRLLFKQLEADISRKDDLINFLDTLIENADYAIKKLEGTPYAGMPAKAKTVNLNIKTLVTGYIEKVEEYNRIQEFMFELIEKSIETADAEAFNSSQAFYDKIKKYFQSIIILMVVSVFIGIVLSLILSKSILNSLSGAASVANRIAEGDLTAMIEVKSKDEIGHFLEGMKHMAQKLREMIKTISGSVDAMSKSSTELSAISEEMAERAAEVTEKTNSSATAIEEMSANMNSVATASEEASTNVKMVASAAEEMAATINEIAQNSEKARAIAHEAVFQGRKASENVTKLGNAASEISKVTEVITEISEQTSLLALNATIEAARAGESGKGFAVVANEIKELARQTPEATQDIKDKIEGIQNSTTETVTEISQISDVIDKVNEIVSIIATAVEEQSVTTKEIAGNVGSASIGIEEVNLNVAQSSSVAGDLAGDIAELNDSVSEMSESISQVNVNAEDMSQLAIQLKDIVDKFKV